MSRNWVQKQIQYFLKYYKLSIYILLLIILSYILYFYLGCISLLSFLMLSFESMSIACYYCKKSDTCIIQIPGYLNIFKLLSSLFPSQSVSGTFVRISAPICSHNVQMLVLECFCQTPTRMRAQHLAGQLLKEQITLKEPALLSLKLGLQCQALLLEWCNSHLQLENYFNFSHFQSRYRSRAIRQALLIFLLLKMLDKVEDEHKKQDKPCFSQ